MGKYAADFGVVVENCFPYTGRDAPCTNEHNCKRYYAKDYKYIGAGYYGGCNEHAMMVELVENGPFAKSTTTSRFTVEVSISTLASMTN